MLLILIHDLPDVLKDDGDQNLPGTKCGKLTGQIQNRTDGWKLIHYQVNRNLSLSLICRIRVGNDLNEEHTEEKA